MVTNKLMRLHYIQLGLVLLFCLFLGYQSFELALAGLTGTGQQMAKWIVIATLALLLLSHVLLIKYKGISKLSVLSFLPISLSLTYIFTTAWHGYASDWAPYSMQLAQHLNLVWGSACVFVSGLTIFLLVIDFKRKSSIL